MTVRRASDYGTGGRRRSTEITFLQIADLVIDQLMTEPKSPHSPHPDELPRWTFDRMRCFIDALRRTRNVAGAARAAGMSRQAAYALRAKLKGQPFDNAWAAAMAQRDMVRRMTAGLHPLTGDDRS